MINDPVMVSREIVGPKTYLLLVGDTLQKVKNESLLLLDMLMVAHHDPYAAAFIMRRNDGKFYTRIEYWTEKEDE